MVNLIAFINQFISYFILFILMVALATGGWFLGAYLRKNKDKKDTILK